MWLRLLGGGSFRELLRRALRLREVARDMRKGELAPAKPVRLQIETTDICNFKCVMCCREVIEGMNTRTMELDEFTTLIGEISPYYVTSTTLADSGKRERS
jgi:hypothetical protein